MVVGGRMAHYAEPLAPAPEPTLGLRSAARRTEPRLAIKDPPPLLHSAATHRAFPADYKAASRVLLLVHQRLQRPELEEAAAAAAMARQTVAELLCRLFRNVVASVVAAAEPAMAAMAACQPRDDAGSPGSDTCALAVGRWLDGRIQDEPSSGGEDSDYETAASSSASPSRAGSGQQQARRQSAAAWTAAVAAAGGVAMDAPQPDAASAAGPRHPAATLHAPCQLRMSTLQQEDRSSAGGDRRRARRQLRLGDGKGNGSATATAEAAEQDAAHLGALFASLPVDLVRHIVHLMAPPLTQHVSLHPAGHPDILPALLPTDPATWAPLPGGADA
ncbi:hypothetical protein GPECTOR_96g733 [Gonium pectorale]|uniref:Uncharacterized protein n=1 Tax=Gonium pectorale TaxID=33097 RepID=A0A150G0A7_GONPE|nr:hypothetical protein GPECTOR_96g733 [Gonium pectorale]|eukprot:KXZ43267.1 hypothetical protein GPECTOR_96g733 [Gonium pectorale]